MRMRVRWAVFAGWLAVDVLLQVSEEWNEMYLVLLF